MYEVNTVTEFLKTVNVYTLVNSDDIYNRFMEYYGYVFDESLNCNACPNDIEQGIFKLNWVVKLHVKNNRTTLMKADKICKYTMKPNVRFFSTSLGIMVTRYNCTDSIAEALIKENPNNINLFTVNSDTVKEVEQTVKPVEGVNFLSPLTGVEGEYGQIPPHPKVKKGRGKTKTKTVKK